MPEDNSTQVRLHLWPQRYAVARLRTIPEPLPALDWDGAPVCLVVGHGEVSLLAPEETIGDVGDCVESLSRDWRAITFDTVFPLDTVGLLAAVSKVLAEVRVPVMAFASHDTDHILVPEHLLGRALAALNQAPLGRFVPRP